MISTSHHKSHHTPFLDSEQAYCTVRFARHSQHPALHWHHHTSLHRAVRVRHQYNSQARTPRRRRRAGNDLCARASTMRSRITTHAYPMPHSTLLSDAFVQEDVETRSRDHVHAGEMRIVWELTVARRRRPRHGHRAGAEVAPVAARRRVMAHRWSTLWRERKTGQE
jgi:hypothetical protein